MMLLNRGEVLIDDLSLNMGRGNILSNSGFESAEANWRRLGQSRQVIRDDSRPSVRITILAFDCNGAWRSRRQPD